jgi:hypothetical protein
LSRQDQQGDFVGNELPPPVVLRTLNRADELAPLSVDAAMRIVNRRIDSNGFSSLDALGQGPLAMMDMETDGLGLASDYFILAAVLGMEGRQYGMQTVLHRYTDALGIPVVGVVSRRMTNTRIEMDQFCVN